MIVMEDTARARINDPATSHAAADASQPQVNNTKFHVLELVQIHTEMTGTEVNDHYSLMWGRWGRVHFDSPRKRAGELAADGYLRVVGERPTPFRGSPESVYALTQWGRRVLRKGAFA